MNVSIYKAEVDHCDIVAEMVMDLLCEIMEATGEPHFNVDCSRLQAQAKTLIGDRSYIVFLAANSVNASHCGFIALFEGYALYTNGLFGVIPELYVRPDHRSQGIGAMLLGKAVAYAKDQGWSCLEVTTPLLPWFDRTLTFYERHGFQISGGKKLRRSTL